jgi:CrcB protein
MALFWTVGNDFRAFLVVGILGSFTTFSTFSLDVMVMFDRGDVLPASLYVLASVGLALIAFMGGMAAVRLAF